jgi:hypothetical protein
MAKHDAAPPDLVGAPSFGAVEAILNGNLGDHLAREAAAIVLDAQKSRRDAAADRFNRLAKTVPIKLSLTSSRMGVLVPALSLGDTYAGVVALHLWRVLGVGAVDRIKRCRACRRDGSRTDHGTARRSSATRIAPLAGGTEGDVDEPVSLRRRSPDGRIVDTRVRYLRANEKMADRGERSSVGRSVLW